MFVLPHYVMQVIHMLGTEMNGVCLPYGYLHVSPWTSRQTQHGQLTWVVTYRIISF